MDLTNRKKAGELINKLEKYEQAVGEFKKDNVSIHLNGQGIYNTFNLTFEYSFNKDLYELCVPKMIEALEKRIKEIKIELEKL